jgi:hypothetical protein
MPCAITEPDNYPDYLKGYLKEVNATNDDDLKACACYLRTPTTDEGCPITDEDGKLVAFPFCLNDTNPNIDSNSGNIANLGLSYKQAMELFWKPVKDKKINFDIKANGQCLYDYGFPCAGYVVGENNLNSDKRSLKSVFCHASTIGLEISEGGDPRSTSHNDLGCAGYGGSRYYMGVGIGLFINYDGFSAWIDKQNQKIYPYMGAALNLGGCYCAPNAIAKDAKINGSSITINLKEFSANPNTCETLRIGNGTSSATVKFNLI